MNNNTAAALARVPTDCVKPIRCKVYHERGMEGPRCLLKHVSDVSHNILLTRGIPRAVGQSVVVYLVHGCSVSSPWSPGGEAQGPVTICCFHYGWHCHVHGHNSPVGPETRL